ncbi:putative SWI/SNF-related matrix-associated actin-dependent regulator of chromatin subfamily A member 3-like 3 [Colletotrichum chlorophyti]|uniref:Putative SWI/SNF-related matrix-associated actin-dependent regulator of chromatin subfamily A member 3-like 3 n=1 Tax=Colletotrichum chlorophyti TaxID=708187 RepID=A0A1Q8RMR8_9PEZI|nr:putative SWI/SNF-related matrix-associated actin-dependent regulator of chromatin subfamily A member 3-like 3 [Colletotrichum chlorophyti]
MSSLKRLLNTEDDEPHYSDPSSVSSYGSIPPSYQGCQDYTGYHPRQTLFQSLSFPTQDEIPSLEDHSSLNAVFNSILFDISAGNQLGALDFGDGAEESQYNLENELETWSRNMSAVSPSPGVYSSPRPFSGSGSSQDSLPVTNSPSLVPESVATRSESCTSAGDDEADKVCYGMVSRQLFPVFLFFFLVFPSYFFFTGVEELYNVDVKLIGDMAVIDTKLRKSQQAAVDRDTIYQRFALSNQQENVLLTFRDDATEFGYLRSAHGRTLARLLNQVVVELEPIAPTIALRETIGRAKKPAEAMVKVDINVYGPRGAARRVGDALSEGKLWLQKPDHARPDVFYENPHELHIRGGEQMPEEVVREVNSGTPAGRQPREESLRRMMMEVYDSIQNNRQLARVHGGNRLKHDLLLHQQEALAFMLERESGKINHRYRLWQPVTIEGQEWFRHNITREKRRTRPSERGGGILADEMGMGKSLSILSLIVKTLENGRRWAEQEEQSDEKNKELHYSGSTLVVVSSALLIYNWMNEVQKSSRRLTLDRHVDGSLTHTKYHGPGRERDIDKIGKSHIVITTYNTLSAEYEKKSSLLHKIGWYRVVLDEAHIIRRPATTFYHACRALHANSRWCLTGTPIQNKLADIGALFAFIRASPFDNPATFRRYIEVPFEQQSDNSQKVKERLIMLLESLCLRRTKDLLELPGLEERVKELEFAPAEREQYDKTKNILLRTIRQKVGEVEKSSKFGLFQANLQMRILCNHGTFQKPFSWYRRGYRLDEREAAVCALGQNAEINCDGCHQPMPILGSSRLRNDFEKQCAHVFCHECLEDSDMSPSGSLRRHCPVCDNWMRPSKSQRAATGLPLVKVDGPSSPGDVEMSDAPALAAYFEDDEDYFNPVGYSTKMQALIGDVKEDIAVTKSIIFSCWTRTLHLVAKHLEEAGVPYLRIDGDCPLLKRQETLVRFANRDDTRVLIMTTGTGAFGLNLTCANRVFIVELQWNPSVENQAIARAIRLGQGKKVQVTRYVIKSTVEEEMRSQQTVKKNLAAIGFDEQACADDMDQSHD